MKLILALSISWLAVGASTSVLHRIGPFFTPKMLVRVLSAGALALCVATTSSAVAAACLLGTGSHPAGWVSAVAIVGVLTAGGVRVLRHALRVRAGVRDTALFRNSSLRAGDVLIIDDDLPDAFAVPGRRAVVVVTTGLRKSLPAAEFAAVLRHERGHLRARHHVHVQVVEFAALMNPLLSRWRAAVRFAAERHADECAAATDRPATARALARAAMLCHTSTRRSTLSIVAGPQEMVRRVRALQAPPPGGQRSWAVAAATVVLLAIAANAVVSADLAQDRLAPERGEALSVVVG